MRETSQNEEKYLDLMKRVGTKGRYQWILYFFSLFTFFNNSLATNNTPMLFYNTKFDCADSSLTYTECQSYVCDQLSEEERKEFPLIKEMESLATQFGPYQCQGNITLAFYRSLLGFGQFVGLFIAVTIADNISRRKAFLLCLSVTIIGMLIIFLASSMLMALIGLFVVGLSNSPNLRIIQSMVAETTEDQLKQKFLSSQLGAFSLASISVGIFYSSIGNWRTSIFYCGLLPEFAILIGFLLLIEDTPKFLMRLSPEEAARALNRIGKINTGEDNLYHTQELLNKMKKESGFKHIKHVVSPLDLVRYPSLRQTAILSILIFMLCDTLFYFHATVVEQIGVNPQFNSLMIGLGEISAIPWAVILIPKFQRKKIFITLFLIGSVFSLATSFIQVPSECDYCQSGILQMGLISLTRFCIIFFWACIYNFFTQFYPVSILSIGSGIPTAFGGLGISLCQIVFLSAPQENINVFLIATGTMLLICLLVLGLPESYNMEKRDQIDEVKFLYEEEAIKNKFQTY